MSVVVSEYVKGGVDVKYISDGLYNVTYVLDVKGRYYQTIRINNVDVETDLSAGVFVVPTQSSAIHSWHTGALWAVLHRLLRAHCRTPLAWVGAAVGPLAVLRAPPHPLSAGRACFA